MSDNELFESNIEIEVVKPKKIKRPDMDPSPFKSGSIADERYSDHNGTTKILGRDFT